MSSAIVQTFSSDLDIIQWLSGSKRNNVLVYKIKKYWELIFKLYAEFINLFIYYKSKEPEKLKSAIWSCNVTSL